MPHVWDKAYNLADRLLRGQKPEAILLEIGLKPGDTLVDIGCGDGFFAIPAARIVGDAGMVRGLDFSSKAIEMLQSSAAEAGLSNIQTTVGDAEQTVLCQHCADFALMANAMHDFKDPVAVLLNARQTLKGNGKLVDLDWKKETSQLHGPPFAKRLSQEKATDLLTQAGFKVMSSALVGPFHYLLIAEPA